MDKDNFQPIDSLLEQGDALIEFCKEQLKIKQPRDDYRELLELTLIVLHETLACGMHIMRPGACHRARWIAKIIYSMKIYLFRKHQLNLTSRELGGIERFVTFVVSLYIPYWFTSSNPASAPSNDLKFLKDLSGYQNTAVSLAALHSFSRHLWYLGEELVGLAFFD